MVLTKTIRTQGKGIKVGTTKDTTTTTTLGKEIGVGIMIVIGG